MQRTAVHTTCKIRDSYSDNCGHYRCLGCDPVYCGRSFPAFLKPGLYWTDKNWIINVYSKDYILITNLMHWLLFIHKILFSSTCFEPQVLIFRRIQFYTCSIWYCHSLWEFVVACRYTAWVRTYCRGKVVGRASSTTFPLTISSLSSCVPTGHQELS